MAQKAAEYPIGHGGQVNLPDYSDYWVISKSSTAVTKAPFRLAMLEMFKISGSAANAVTVSLKDGSASGATTVIKTTGRTINTSYLFPYVRFPNGLYVDVSGSATTVEVHVFGVVDND